MKNGSINSVYNGISKNEYYVADRETFEPQSPVRPMSEDTIPNRNMDEVAIVGLEDVRLVPGDTFYAITKSFSYAGTIRMIMGTYDWKSTCYRNTVVLRPPYQETSCEKNWVWCGENRFIYKWHPIQIGSVVQDRLVIDEYLPSPEYFREFRGSSPVVSWKGLSFFSVHTVSFSSEENTRIYLHSLVVLDLNSEKHAVVGTTSPFCFERPQIEYNIGLDIYKGYISFLYSTRDSTSRYLRFPLWRMLEMMCFPNKDMETLFKTRIYQDVF
jgi:hypothetical protein